MAKIFNVVLALSLLLISMAQARISDVQTVNPSSVTCKTIYGVESGDSCASISKLFEQKLEVFLTINPNVDCLDLFVGQWVCVKGKTA